MTLQQSTTPPPQPTPDPRADQRWVADDPGAAPSPQQVFAAGMRHHHLANTAYPIAHRKTIWHLRRGARQHRRLLRRAIPAETPLGLYLHVPFCERRCHYCEYCVVSQHDAELEARYHRALMAEIALYRELLDRDEGPRLVGLDIGGGTPSLIAASRVIELVQRVRQSFALQPGFSISIETTPKVAALQPDKLLRYRGAGIDRISMGLQMVNPRLLRDYGRDLNQVGYNRQAVDNIRRAGFERFNIDLMYGMARQSVDDVRRSVGYTVALGPESITLYRMRYKGTRIADEAALVPHERAVQMYEAARGLLLQAGYHGNPGKNGFSRLPDDPGTSAYLTARVVHGTPYLGLGLGAQSFTNNLLAYNLGAASKRLPRYLAAVDRGQLPIQDLYHLSREEGLAKMIAVAFYFGRVNRRAVRQRFGVELSHRFAAEVRFLRRRGLVQLDRQHLSLTRAGSRCFGGVVAQFYSRRVKRHLLALGRGRGQV